MVSKSIIIVTVKKEVSLSLRVAIYSPDMDWEMDRRDITLRGQLGVGEFGPIYDAEVQLGLNMTSRAVVKVCVPPV